MARTFELEDVVAGLYEAAALPEQWSDALAAVATFTQSKASHFFDFNPRTRTGSWGALGWVPGVDVDPACDELYRTYYGAIDPRFSLGAVRNPGKVWSCAEFLADTDIPGVAELYNDFLEPNGMRWTLGFGETISGGGMLILTALRGVAEGPYGEAEKDCLRRITPHVAHIYRLNSRLAQARTANGLMLAALEKSSTGFIICDAAARVLYANASAVAAASGGGISLAGGRIGSERPSVEVRLKAHIRVAATPTARVQSGAGHAVRIDRGGGRCDLFILVAPLPAPAAPDGTPQAPAALLILDTVRPGAVPSGRHLVDWFGLSAGEAQLAIELLSGARIEDIAERRQVKISTVRTQLSHILAKTGTTRQTELLALLNRLPTGGARSGSR